MTQGNIPLPEGWTWKRVETERAKWDMADNMIPVACAPGVVAWGTINSVLNSQRIKAELVIGDAAFDAAAAAFDTKHNR